MTPDTTLLRVLWQYHFNPLEYLSFATPLIAVVFALIALRTESLKTRITLAASAVIALLTSCSIIGETIRFMGYARNVHAGEMAVVEGTVDSFRPYVSHRSDEMFTVGGVRFSYDPAVITGGYSTPAEDGGVIRQGRYLRLYYLQGSRTPIILRIDGRSMDQKPLREGAVPTVSR